MSTNKCIACGKPVKRQFCSPECARSFHRGNPDARTATIRTETYFDLPLEEHKKRTSLLLKAKAGSKHALRTLKKDYRLTAIFNGKEMVKCE